MMYAFISYETVEQATKALNEMNGKTLEGRILTIKYGKDVTEEKKEHMPSIKVSNVHFKIRD